MFWLIAGADTSKYEKNKFEERRANNAEDDSNNKSEDQEMKDENDGTKVENETPPAEKENQLNNEVVPETADQ